MSAARRKGTAFETAVVEFLKAHGFPYAERRAQRGTKDAGDVAGVPGFCLELKNHNRLELAVWSDEAARESRAAGVWRWAVVAKRRGKNVRDAYVVCPLWVWCEMASDLMPTAQEEFAG